MQTRRSTAGSNSGFLASMLLLTVHGVLLWVVIPMGCVAWVLGAPWLHKRRIKIGQFLGWIDINLIALIQHSLLRPFYRNVALPWLSARKISKVVHRLGLMDLY